MLQDNEVDELRLPEYYVVLYGYTVVTKDVDLLGNLLTTEQAGLDFVDLSKPLVVDALRDIGFKLGILQVL